MIEFKSLDINSRLSNKSDSLVLYDKSPLLNKVELQSSKNPS